MMPVNYQEQFGEKNIEDLVSYIVHESSTFRLEAAQSSAGSNDSRLRQRKKAHNTRWIIQSAKIVSLFFVEDSNAVHA